MSVPNELTGVIVSSEAAVSESGREPRRRRYLVLAILFACYLICYTDRMAIATAIPFIAKDFGLSPLGMGGVMSAFFIGYALTQMPGGMLADAVGPRRVMTVSILCWSFFTLLTGLAGSISLLIAIRVCFGLSEGAFPPSATKAVATWFPQDEVGKANGFQLAAVQIGAAIAPITVSWVISRWDWRAVFYCLLVPGLLLALLVWFFVKDKASTSPESRDARAAEQAAPAVGKVLALPSVRWGAITIFLWSIAAWGLMNWLPTYLLQARQFSLSRMGVLGSLPYLAGAAGYFFGGQLSGVFGARRFLPIAGGLVLGGASTYWAAVSPSGGWAVVALCVAFLAIFISAGGIFTLPLMTVPRPSVGVAFGFINTAAQTAAFLSPLAVGAVLKITHGDFTAVLYGFVGFFLIAAITALRIASPAER